MLTLYHNALSTCSQKVRLVLAEKGIEFESKLIDLVAGQQHAPDYVALNPKHVVPTLVAGGEVVRESSIIAEYLDACVAGNPLTPEDPLAAAKMRMWVRRIDDDIHGRTSGVFTHAIWTRRAVGGRPPAEIEKYLAAIPEDAERALRRELIANGVASPRFAGAVSRMGAFLSEMEAALSRAEWLVGERFTLADIAAAPYVLRVSDTGLSGLFGEGRRPAVADWLERVRKRPSFEQAVTAWAPAPLLAAMRSFSDGVSAEIRQAIAAHDVKAAR
jgi:glutathione S-transferase